jgi:hypothetical protein
VGAAAAAAAVAPASSIADAGEQHGAGKQQQQLVAVKQERLDKHDRQDRERKLQQQQQLGPASSDQAGSDRQGATAERHAKHSGQIVLAAGGRGDVHAVEQRRQQQQQQQQQHAAVYVEPPGGGQWRQAQLQLSKVHNFQQLLCQLQGEFPHLLPERDMLRIKVVYQDSDGDWLMALPDQRWRAFVEVARKVLVCHTP